MVGVNVIAADTDAEARRLATSQQMSFTNILRGARALHASRRSTTSTPTGCRTRSSARRRCWRAASSGASRPFARGLDTLIERTRADELIVVSDVYDFATRLRSFELIAQAGDVRPES